MTDELSRTRLKGELAASLEERDQLRRERDDLRSALIRLLWRCHVDVGEPDRPPEVPACPGDCDDLEEPTLDLCAAMRALGFGDHWDHDAFADKAIQEERL